MSLTDEAKVKVFNEVMQAVGVTLRQYATERSSEDSDVFREIVDVSADALVATVMCARLASVGFADDSDNGMDALNDIAREASEAIWDIVERFEAEHRNSK